MAFNFESLNYERKFDFDVAGIRGKYADCKEMFEKYGSDKVFRVNAIYISTLSKYIKPTLALDETYVNLPTFLLDEANKLLNDKSACDQINSGKVGVTFYSYIKELKKKTKNGEKKIKKVCYSIKWVDMSDYTWDDDDDDDEDDDE